MGAGGGPEGGGPDPLGGGGPRLFSALAGVDLGAGVGPEGGGPDPLGGGGAERDSCYTERSLGLSFAHPLQSLLLPGREQLQ